MNAGSASALIDALIAGGVAHAVLSPGSRSTPIALTLDAAARASRLVLHPILDERSAAFFALGVARSSGRPVIVVATSGSAGAHFLPAVIEAFESGVPLIVITADRPPELQGVGAPQTTPQADLFGAHAKTRVDLPVPGPDVSVRVFRTAGLRAIASATAAKQGPVHIQAPFREPLWTAGEDAGERLAPARLISGARTLDRAQLAKVASWLSPRGVIIAGPMETPAPAAVTLAERLGWPILADAASNLRAGGHPNVLTHGDAIVRAQSDRLAPDVVFKIGRAPSSKATQEWLAKVGRDRLVLVDDLVDHGHLAKALIAAEPNALFAALSDATPATDRTWLAGWQAADRIAERVLEAPAAKLWEGQVARAIARAIGPNTLVHLGSGMPVRDFDACGGALASGVRVFSSRGANGIDGTTSTALGELAGSGLRTKMISVTGDLTALHDLSGLRMARGQDITMVVIDNGGGGIFDFLPIAAHSESYQRCFKTPQEADFGAIARAFGIEAREATTADAIAAAIATPGLVRIPIDPTHNVRAHRERWAESARQIQLYFEAYFSKKGTPHVEEGS